MAQKRRRVVRCIDEAAFMADFGMLPTTSKALPQTLTCALCFVALERVTAIFGQLFQTIIHITTIDAKGMPVGMDVPKYTKAHLCKRCFKNNEGVRVDNTPYLSFQALTPNDKYLTRNAKGLVVTTTQQPIVDEHIPTTQTIDPYDDRVDKKGYAHFCKGKGMSPRLGRNIQPQTVTLKDSPSTKRFRDMIEELKKS